MNETEILKVLLDEFGNVAPDVDMGLVDPSQDLREALDIDSIDFLNVITALHKRLGIDIPELDYPKLFTLDAAVAYIAAKLAARQA